MTRTRPPRSVAQPAVIRAHGPSDLVAMLPQLLGFRPQESLVLLALRGPRQRLELAMRIDVPADDAASEAVGALAVRARRAGADAVLALVVSEHQPPGPVGARLAAALTERLAAQDLQVVDVLRVGHGRWWSGPCPPECLSLIHI